LLADSIRRRARGSVLPRLRARAPDEALPARVAADGRRARDSLLLLLARPDRELADPRADRLAVHLAMRRRDVAASLSARSSAAICDVAVPCAGHHRAGALDLRLLVGAGERNAVRAGIRRLGRRRLLRVRSRSREQEPRMKSTILAAALVAVCAMLPAA